jgi:hypothetical protein
MVQQFCIIAWYNMYKEDITPMNVLTIQNIIYLSTLTQMTNVVIRSAFPLSH